MLPMEILYYMHPKELLELLHKILNFSLKEILIQTKDMLVLVLQEILEVNHIMLKCMQVN